MSTEMQGPPKPDIRMVPLDVLWEPRFNRPVSPSWVNDKAQRYDPDQIGVLKTADSSAWDPNDWRTGIPAGQPGYLAIIDGQGRGRLLREVGVESVLCEVTVCDVARAAEIAVGVNKGRRDIKAFYRLRMEWAAEHDMPLAMRARVEALGLKLAPDTNHDNEIGAISAVEDVFYGRRGVSLVARQDCLTPALTLLRDALRRRHQCWHADLIGAAGLVYSWNPDDDLIDHDRLVATLASRMPQGWVVEMHGATDQSHRRRRIARDIVDEYNLGRLAGIGVYKKLSEQKGGLIRA